MRKCLSCFGGYASECMGCYLLDEHVIIWTLDIIWLILVCMMENILLLKLFV